MISNRQPSGSILADSEAELAFKIEIRFHEHPAKCRVARDANANRTTHLPWTLNLDFDSHLAIEIVTAADRLLLNLKIEARLMLRHTPYAFASFYRDFRAHRKIDDELTCSVVPPEEGWKQPRGRLKAMCAGNRDAEFDVFPD